MHEWQELVAVRCLTAACVIAALTAAPALAQTPSQDEAKDAGPLDAAQAVQEGSVPQWLEYYRRERGLAEPAPAKVPPSAPADPGGEQASKRNPQR